MLKGTFFNVILCIIISNGPFDCLANNVWQSCVHAKKIKGWGKEIDRIVVAQEGSIGANKLKS